MAFLDKLLGVGTSRFYVSLFIFNVVVYGGWYAFICWLYPL